MAGACAVVSHSVLVMLSRSLTDRYQGYDQTGLRGGLRYLRELFCRRRRLGGGLFCPRSRAERFLSSLHASPCQADASANRPSTPVQDAHWSGR